MLSMRTPTIPRAGRMIHLRVIFETLPMPTGLTVLAVLPTVKVVLRLRTRMCTIVPVWIRHESYSLQRGNIFFWPMPTFHTAVLPCLGREPPLVTTRPVFKIIGGAKITVVLRCGTTEM